MYVRVPTTKNTLPSCTFTHVRAQSLNSAEATEDTCPRKMACADLTNFFTSAIAKCRFLEKLGVISPDLVSVQDGLAFHLGKRKGEKVATTKFARQQQRVNTRSIKSAKAAPKVQRSKALLKIEEHVQTSADGTIVSFVIFVRQTKDNSNADAVWTYNEITLQVRCPHTYCITHI